MALHPLAEEFAGLAEVYERGRPGYPAPVGRTIAEEAGMAAGDPVLDLAAGTGKLTRALVEAGLEVTAVEPQAELRALLAAAIGAERVREGLAEAIPAPDGAFAAVTVADAFHWFDQAAALAEIRRVLRPGGALVLLTTVPELPDAIGRLIAEARVAEGATPHPFFDGTPWEETLAAAEGWGAPRRIDVATRQRLPLRDYVRSMSWVAALPDADREALVSRVPDETPEVTVRTVMWLTARD